MLVKSPTGRQYYWPARCSVLLKLGRIDEARVALQKAITLEPEFAKPHEDLGRLFLVRKEPGQAVRHFSTGHTAR